jgi:hypothetical protein
MDEEVIGYNLNYPYKTSSDYVLVRGRGECVTLGFIPVKLEEARPK